MITSVTNNHIKELHKLKTKKHRIEQGKFLVEGYHLVEEAIKAGCMLEVLCTEEYDFDNTTLVTPHIIEKLSSTKSPQNIIGVCSFFKKSSESEKYIYLDVSDPVNLGTLIRSAAGFGFNVILSHESCDEYSSKVLRGSQGAIFYTQIERMSFDEAVERYPYTIYAADMNGTTDFEPVDQLILVMGNESAGLKEDLRLNSKLIRIDTQVIESLNLSVAGSILMHKLKG